MNKKIEFKYQDTDYCLEYDRNAIMAMEKEGFSLENIKSQSVTMTDIAFTYAFLKNHKKVTSQKINEIFESLHDKTGLLGALIEMYQEAYISIYSDNEDESKNTEWKIV